MRPKEHKWAVRQDVGGEQASTSEAPESLTACCRAQRRERKEQALTRGDPGVERLREVSSGHSSVMIASVEGVYHAAKPKVSAGRRCSGPVPEFRSAHRQNAPTGLLARVTQRFWPQLAVAVGGVYVPPLVAARHDVATRPGTLDAYPARHRRSSRSLLTYPSTLTTSFRDTRSNG